jgi:hypothetical protein
MRRGRTDSFSGSAKANLATSSHRMIWISNILSVSLFREEHGFNNWNVHAKRHLGFSVSPGSDMLSELKSYPRHMRGPPRKLRLQKDL